MVYINRKKEDIRFLMFILISFCINLMFFLIPSCNYNSVKEELKYETLKAGLISITDVDKVEYRIQDTAQNAEERLSAQEIMKSKETSEIFTGESSKGSRTKEKIEVLTSDKSNPVRIKEELLNKDKENGGNKGNNQIKDGNKKTSEGNNKKNTEGNEGINSGNIPVLGDSKGDINGVKNTIPKNTSAEVINMAGAEVVWVNYEKPEYPIEAQQKGWVGEVAVEFHVKGGKSTYKGIIGKSGYNSLDNAVERVAKSWKLTIKQGAKSVDGKIRVKVKFSL